MNINRDLYGHTGKGSDRLSHNTCSDEEMMLQQLVTFRKSVQAFRRSFPKFQ